MSNENEHNRFTFNGHSSYGLMMHIEKYPSIPIARKRMTEIVVAGMDGVLHQSDGSYEPVPVRYKCWFTPNPENPQESLADRAHIIAEWLGNAPAGVELSDTYDPLIYRRATYVGGADIQSIMGRSGKFDVEFSCDPRAYLTMGRDFQASPDSPIGADNTTGHYSKPLVTITCAEAGSVVFQARQGENILKTYTIDINFPDHLPHTFTFDCAIGESWGLVNGVMQSFNPWLTVPELPQIHPGTNTIEVAGGVSSATVDMRWWVL